MYGLEWLCGANDEISDDRFKSGLDGGVKCPLKSVADFKRATCKLEQLYRIRIV